MSELDDTAFAILRALDDCGGTASFAALLQTNAQAIVEKYELDIELERDDMTGAQQKDTAAALRELAEIIKAYASDFDKAAKHNFY